MPAMTRLLPIALVAAVACGHPAPPPASPAAPAPAPVAAPTDAAAPALPLDQDLPTLAARSTQMYQAVAAAFATAGADCAGATSKLAAIRSGHADVTTAVAKVLHEGRARELRAALSASEDALDAAAKAIVDSETMRKCSQDAAFASAFDFIGAPP